VTQSAVASGSDDGLACHVSQVCAYNKIHGHTGPEHQRASDETAADAEESAQDAHQESDDGEEQWVDYHPGDGEFHR
jgi:hypothetical protein